MENYKAAFGGEGGCWVRLVPKAAIGGVSPIRGLCSICGCAGVRLTMKVYTSYRFLRFKDVRSHLLRHDNPIANNPLNNHNREAACKLRAAPRLTERSFPSAVARSEACLGLYIKVINETVMQRLAEEFRTSIEVVQGSR
jgi:hypothetical protein